MFRAYSEALGHLAGAVVFELLDDFVVLAQFDPLFTSVKKIPLARRPDKQTAIRERVVRCGAVVRAQTTAAPEKKTLTGSRWSGTCETTGSACSYWNSYIC